MAKLTEAQKELNVLVRAADKLARKLDKKGLDCEIINRHVAINFQSITTNYDEVMKSGVSPIFIK